MSEEALKRGAVEALDPKDASVEALARLYAQRRGPALGPQDLPTEQLNDLADRLLIALEPALYKLAVSRYGVLTKRRAPGYQLYLREGGDTELDDLLQRGRDAVSDCLRRYDPARGPFEHYLMRSAAKTMKSLRLGDSLGMSAKDLELQSIIRRALDRAPGGRLGPAGLQEAVLALLEADWLEDGQAAPDTPQGRRAFRRHLDEFNLRAEHLQELAVFGVASLQQGRDGEGEEKALRRSEGLLARAAREYGEAAGAEDSPEESELEAGEEEAASGEEAYAELAAAEAGEQAGGDIDLEDMLARALPRPQDFRARLLLRLRFGSSGGAWTLPAQAKALGLPMASVEPLARRALEALRRWQASRRGPASAAAIQDPPPPPAPSAREALRDADPGTAALNRSLALLLLLASRSRPLTRLDIARALPWHYPVKGVAEDTQPTLADLKADEGFQKKMQRDLSLLQRLGWKVEALAAEGGSSREPSLETYSLAKPKLALDPAFALEEAEAESLARALKKEARRSLLNYRERNALVRLLALRAPLKHSAEEAEGWEDEPNLALCQKAEKEEFALGGLYRGEEGRSESRTLSMRGWFSYESRIYVVAEDHADGRTKVFDPARFKALKRVKAPWKAPQRDFDLDRYVTRHRRWLERQPRAQVLVRDPHLAAWARERYPWLQPEQGAEGAVFPFYVDKPGDFYAFLLRQFGAAAEVLGPPELRRGFSALLEEAK